MCQCSPCPATIVHYEEPTEYVNLDIHAFPLPPPPPPPPKPGVPPHLQKILEKYPYNWRLEQLSKQVLRKQRSKYTGPPKPPPKKTPIRIPEIEFYADHLSRPPLRTVVINNKLFEPYLSRKRKRYFDRIIKRTWNSIYNYYKKKARDKKKRTLQALAAKKDLKAQKSQKTIDLKRIESLAQPKKVFFPPKKETKKKKKTWKDCPDCLVHLEALATPPPRKELPTKKIGWVSPAAKAYTATPNILKLATNFERFTKILPPLELGKVNKNALRYKITHRMEELAVPKKRSEKEVEDSEWDPWAISKNALKYKASTRILELAKPKERD